MIPPRRWRRSGPDGSPPHRRAPEVEGGAMLGSVGTDDDPVASTARPVRPAASARVETDVGVDVVVNGDRHAVSAGTTVADLVSRWCPSPDGIAVARNREVVPKSEWASTLLAARDR